MADVKNFPVHTAGAGQNVDHDSYLGRIFQWIEDVELFDQPENYDYAELMEETLQPAVGTDTKLGPLSTFEKQIYAMHYAVRDIIEDAINDIQASSVEQILKIQKERKVGFQQAASIHQQESGERAISRDDELYLGRCMFLQHHLWGTFQFNVRTRFDIWERNVSVRAGYVAYENDEQPEVNIPGNG